jgi:amidase
MQITEPDALFHATASWLAAAIRARKVSCVEVMEAHLQRIDAINPMVNAIVTLTAERALASARDADARFASGEPCGLLHGLPVAHKDLALTKGMRTTFGSPIFENFIPDQDALIVERLRAAGAIAVGKTNTPEFGAGSHTFNPVFGATRNPHALDRSSGGSSGGAAAALAAGLVPIADGTAIWVGRCAIPRRSAVWSACVPPRAECRAGQPSWPGIPCRSKARWRGQSRMSP